MPSNKIRHNWGDSTAETESVYSLTNTGIEDTVHGWDDSKYEDWMYRIEKDTRVRHIWLSDWMYNEIKIESDPHRVRLLNTDMSLVDVLDRRVFQYAKDLVDIRGGEDQDNPMFHITVDAVNHELRIMDDRDNLMLFERDKDRICLKTKQEACVDMEGDNLGISTKNLLDIKVGEEQDNPMFHVTVDAVNHELRIMDDRGNLILLERDKDRIYLKTKQESYVDMEGDNIGIYAKKNLELGAGEKLHIYTDIGPAGIVGV